MKRVRRRGEGRHVEPARRPRHAWPADQGSGAYERLNASLANLQEMTQRINAGEGSLGRFLKDDALAKSPDRDVGEPRTVTGRLNRNDNTWASC